MSEYKPLYSDEEFDDLRPEDKVVGRSEMEDHYFRFLTVEQKKFQSRVEQSEPLNLDVLESSIDSEILSRCKNFVDRHFEALKPRLLIDFDISEEEYRMFFDDLLNVEEVDLLMQLYLSGEVGKLELIYRYAVLIRSEANHLEHLIMRPFGRVAVIESKEQYFSVEQPSCDSNNFSIFNFNGDENKFEMLYGILEKGNISDFEM